MKNEFKDREKIEAIVKFTLEGTFDNYRQYYINPDTDEPSPIFVVQGTINGKIDHLLYFEHQLHALYNNGGLNDRLLEDRKRIFKDHY